MKNLALLLVSVAVAAGLFLAAGRLVPEPPPLPRFTSRAPAPLSVKPTPKPGPLSAPDWKTAVPDSAAFNVVAPASRKDALPLMVDVKGHRVLFSGEFACNEGRLEYLLTSLGGKTYESLVLAHANPRDLNVCLIAAGAVLPDGYDSRRFRGRDEGKDVDPVWPRLKVELIYREPAGGWRSPRPWKKLKTVRTRAERLIFHQFLDRPMKDQLWAYTGSYFYVDSETGAQIWLASATKCLGAIFYDASCFIQNTDEYWHDDDAYVALPTLVPPVGTGVLVLVTVVGAGEDSK